jgi:hypothetical protein
VVGQAQGSGSGLVVAMIGGSSEQMFPYQADSFTRVGCERGWGPYTRAGF